MCVWVGNFLILALLGLCRWWSTPKTCLCRKWRHLLPRFFSLASVCTAWNIDLDSSILLCFSEFSLASTAGNSSEEKEKAACCISWWDASWYRTSATNSHFQASRKDCHQVLLISRSHHFACKMHPNAIKSRQARQRTHKELVKGGEGQAAKNQKDKKDENAKNEMTRTRSASTCWRVRKAERLRSEYHESRTWRWQSPRQGDLSETECSWTRKTLWSAETCYLVPSCCISCRFHSYKCA